LKSLLISSRSLSAGKKENKEKKKKSLRKKERRHQIRRSKSQGKGKLRLGPKRKKNREESQVDFLIWATKPNSLKPNSPKAQSNSAKDFRTPSINSNEHFSFSNSFLIV
jgi:hypothetical protein